MPFFHSLDTLLPKFAAPARQGSAKMRLKFFFYIIA